MSKELKALIKIEDLLNRLYETDVIDDDHTHDTNIIGEALKRLEEYDKTEYSALIERHKELLKEKKASEKKLKALEIIKDKAVSMAILIQSTNVKEYNYCKNLLAFDLTKEEYDLLKEVLL